jgi:radical SAM-linked protein
VDTPPGGAGRRAVAPEPRQRWRLTYARTAAEGGAALQGREYSAVWETALASSSLPLVTGESGRPRLAVAAPLPSGAAADEERADVWLTERLTSWRVREALTGHLPAGHTLVALEDVWLGAPALPGRVAAADYRVVLDGPIEPAAASEAAGRLLAAERLHRERTKGGDVRTYDLRPLLLALAVDAADGRTVLHVRVRIHPELGSGRPDEVVAALAGELGSELVIDSLTRERIVLTDELDA